MGVISATVRVAIGVVLAVVALPWCVHLLTTSIALAHGLPSHPWSLASGLLLGAGLVWWRKPNWLVHTFIHEACHAVLCIVLRVRITAFQATDGQGGAVLHRKVDPLRTTLIALAPYTLPLLLGPLLLARQMIEVPSTAGRVLTFLVGFFTVHHLHGLYHNIRINFWGRQADLTRAGKILSLVVILGVHCLLGAWWVAVLW